MVIHDHFGEGVVTKMYNDDQYCEVDFQQIGVRFVSRNKLSLKELMELSDSENSSSLAIPNYLKEIEDRINSL